MLNTIHYPNIIDDPLQELDNDAWINTTNKWDDNNIHIYTTSKWIIMEKKNEGKAPTQDYSQFAMHEGASSRVKPSGSTSLQEDVPATVTSSNGDMLIALQDILSRNLQFHNGTCSELPNSIKLILDSLQFAFIGNHHDLFHKTLRNLEIHLVNLIAQNEAYVSHQVNPISENDLALENNFALKNDIVSKNEAFESHLLTTQISKMNPILVNSLAKRTSIQWIKRLLRALITQD